MKNKFLLSSLFLLLLIFVPNYSFSQEKIEVDFFYSPTCPHCAQEKEFLNSLKEKYPEIKIREFNSFEKKNYERLEALYQQFDVPEIDQGWVPVIFIGEKYYTGFAPQIAEKIEKCIEGTIAENPLDESSCEENNPTEISAEIASLIEERGGISLPIIGKINISNSSPLILSIVLGTLDGFNACAMIALGLLLTILISTGIRKRVLLIGGTFILVSGAVYFLFISAWLNLFLALEHIKIITYLVGAIVIFFSIFLLKDYFQDRICKLCQIDPKKQTIFTKFEKKLLRKIEKFSTSQMSLPVLLGGVIVVAIGINLVELVCSVGIPLAFTKILSTLNLSSLSYYFYLVIYIIFYMIDDFIIFLIAIITLKSASISEKYLKAVKLISGIALLILGFLMIFHPEILTF